MGSVIQVSAFSQISASACRQAVMAREPSVSLNKRSVTKDLQSDWNWIRYHIGGKMFAAVCLDSRLCREDP